ncbi:MAG: ribonuclease HI [Alphaproteobacteria bacterium]|nr:ribonuclease HI [Alphaproteobacteria bacterium]
MDEIHIYTDGACSGNPGPGGWGAVIQENHETRELFGGEDHTTNNRMEMLATIKALESVLNSKKIVHLHTDSTYVKDGITSWVKNWQKNNWKTASNKPVKNQDLWQKLIAICDKKEVSWHWVKGHAGHPENERADFLARNGVMQQMMKAAIEETAKKGSIIS